MGAIMATMAVKTAKVGMGMITAKRG